MNLKIERLPSRKWHQFYNLRCEAIKSDPHAFRMTLHEESKISQEQWQSLLTNMWFALVDKEIVGMIGTLKESSLVGKHCAQIISFWVRPEYRGKGIGKKLIQHVQSYAKAHDIKKLYLHVNQTQKSAIGLYEKLGFENIGILKKHAKYEDSYLDTYIMEWLYSPQAPIAKLLIIILSFFCSIELSAHDKYITPHKFESYQEAMRSDYKAPASTCFSIARQEEPTLDINYYYSVPNSQNFPIAILCGGSSLEENIISIIHFHRYFLQEFLDLNCGVITVEQRGVNAQKIDKKEFIKYYTRSARLNDHIQIIEHLKNNPPQGWNGKFIFLGVSEGGPIVTRLTELNQENTCATINWAGADDWPWNDELWAFIETIKKTGPWWLRLASRLPQWIPLGLPRSRAAYDACVNIAISSPTPDKKYFGMTYKYHSDAQNFPRPNYQIIKTPFLVVIGTKDPNIESFDAFIKKAQDAQMDLSIIRVEGMDHYIRCRPDIIEQSFVWLAKILQTS